MRFFQWISPWSWMFKMSKTLLIVLLLNNISYACSMLCPISSPVSISIPFDPLDVHNGVPFHEVSGTAVSRKQLYRGSNIVYVVNDSGGSLRFAAYNANTGERIKTFAMNKIKGITKDDDWEDIAVGPCSMVDDNVDEWCVYISNTGDNTARDSHGEKTGRDVRCIIKIKEPTFSIVEDPNSVYYVTSADGVTVLPVKYTGNESPTKYADVEGIFVDPIGDAIGGRRGDVYLISRWKKRDIEHTRVFKYPFVSQMHASGVAPVFELEVVSMDVRPSEGSVTRADISADGNLIAIAQALKIECPFKVPSPSNASKYESAALMPSGAGLLQVSECSSNGPCSPTLEFVTLNFSISTATNSDSGYVNQLRINSTLLLLLVLPLLVILT